MRRSRIDELIEAGAADLTRAGIALPPRAEWDLRTWAEHADEAGELARRGIGWDLTDFGGGDFERRGLLLYTLSNGLPDDPGGDQPYANKLLMVGESQVTPTHHHWSKVEDIVALAGGRLAVRLHNCRPDDTLDRDSPVRVLLNNAWVTCAAGTTITLAPGERVRLERHHYHAFWGAAGGGTVFVEEVSAVNDDARDNCFLPEERAGRFPEIEEDREPRYLLCRELPGSAAFERLARRYLGG